MINPPSETIEQQRVVQYLRIKKIPHFAPNAENQSSSLNRTVAIKVEVKAKSMGKSKGFPDLQILKANKYYHGLFIEMKRRAKKLKSGKLSISHTKTSIEQLEWIDRLNNEGYYAIVCYGAIEAIEVIENYMDEV